MNESYDPEKKGGWLAGTIKEPRAVLQTIWQMARRDDRGLIGFPNDDPDILEFRGIRIRIVAKELNEVFEHPLNLEITDPRAIRPGFFDFWINLRMLGLVDDGPGEKDRDIFLPFLDQYGAGNSRNRKIQWMPGLLPDDRVPERDKRIAKLWCEQWTGEEIGEKVNLSPRTVYNIISDLRKTYPEANIPTDPERKERLRGK